MSEAAHHSRSAICARSTERAKLRRSAARRQSRRSRRRVPFHRRPLRLGQIHPVPHRRRPHAPHFGRSDRSWPQRSAVGDAGRTELRRKYVSFVFQKFNLLPNLTARDNIRAALYIAGLPTEPFDRRVSEHSGAARHRRPPGSQAHRAVRRRAAACRHRPRPRHPPRHSAGRRAHRQPRYHQLPGRARICCAISTSRLGQTILMITHNTEAAAYGAPHRAYARRPHRRKPRPRPLGPRLAHAAAASIIATIRSSPASQSGNKSTYCVSRWIRAGTRQSSSRTGIRNTSSSGIRLAHSSACRISAWKPPRLCTEFREKHGNKEIGVLDRFLYPVRPVLSRAAVYGDPATAHNPSVQKRFEQPLGSSQIFHRVRDEDARPVARPQRDTSRGVPREHPQPVHFHRAASAAVTRRSAPPVLRRSSGSDVLAPDLLAPDVLTRRKPSASQVKWFRGPAAALACPFSSRTNELIHRPIHLVRSRPGLDTALPGRFLN